jgi:hypothetical protein
VSSTVEPWSCTCHRRYPTGPPRNVAGRATTADVCWIAHDAGRGVDSVCEMARDGPTVSD